MAKFLVFFAFLALVATVMSAPAESELEAPKSAEELPKMGLHAPETLQGAAATYFPYYYNYPYFYPGYFPKYYAF